MPFTYDVATQTFTFSPQLTDPVGTLINQSAQFYFADFPALVWNAPIQLNTLAFDSGQLSATGQTTQVSDTSVINFSKTEKETEELVKKLFQQPRLESTPLQVYSFKFEEPIEIHLGSIDRTQRIGNDPEIEADFGSGTAFLELLLVPDLRIVQKTAINNADIGFHNVKVTLTTFIDKVKITKTYRFVLIIDGDLEQSSGKSTVVEVSDES